MFAADPVGFTDNVWPANDLSSVMYGHAIKIDLAFKQFAKDKEVRFPQGTKWVNLNNYDVLIAPDD